MSLFDSFRFKCFFTHVMISFVIACLSLILIFKCWYVYPFNNALNVGTIVVLMIVIDVILGPLLTFILAKKGKKGLKFDFFIIALVQLSALVYGLYTLEKARPVWIVFDSNRFELVQKYMVDRSSNMINNEYVEEPVFSPKWVSARKPKNRQEQDEWMFYEFEKGTSPASRPELYQSITENKNRIIKEKKQISELYKFNTKEKVESITQKYPEADGFLPLKTSENDMAVLIDSKGNDFIVAVVNLKPWA